MLSTKQFTDTVDSDYSSGEENAEDFQGKVNADSSWVILFFDFWSIIVLLDYTCMTPVNKNLNMQQQQKRWQLR